MRDDYLQRLGQKYRYNVRKEVLAFEDRLPFEYFTAIGADPSYDVIRLYLRDDSWPEPG